MENIINPWIRFSVFIAIILVFPTIALSQVETESVVKKESTADFIHKMAIAQKEANETEYWLELLFQSQFLEATQYNSIIADIQELNKILASIIITSKEKKYGKR